VTLLAGPVCLPTPAGVQRIDVRSALDMRAALWRVLGEDLSGAHALVMAAAVADHRPAQIARSKIKKGDASASIELVKNPDLLGEVGEARQVRAGQAAKRPGGAMAGPVLVGFAVETSGGEALVAYARRKLKEKNVDLVVANEAADSFGREDNRVTLVTSAEEDTLPRASKSLLAKVILDRVRALL